MISAFGYSFQALMPWALAAAPLALGALVYIYRRHGSGRNVIVSTLYLLQKLPEHLPGRKRFLPPFEFWLELLAFCCLAGAAAGLYATRTGKHVAILIDSSMSMEAVDRSGLSFFETARTAAINDVSSAPLDTRFSVFNGGASLTLLNQGGPVSGSEGLALLQPLQPQPNEDRIAAQIHLLLNDDRYDAIWVYTDHTLDGELPPASVKISSVYPQASSADLTNVWFSGLQTNDEAGTSFINATLSLASKQAVDLSIVLICKSNDGNPVAPLTKDVHLAPRTPTVLKLGPLAANWSYCEARAEITTAGIRDDIPSDSHAWIAHGEQTREVWLKGDLEPSQLGLDRISGVTIKPMPRSENQAQLEAPTILRPVIYHRTVPSQAPSTPTLVIFPPPGKLPWGGLVKETDSSNAPITRWLSSHPLLQYVQLPLLSIPKQRILMCPPSSTPVLYGATGAIACAGELEGKRYVIFGFELLPFDGMKSPTLSILTLNTIKWLFQSGETFSSRVGEPVALPIGAVASQMVIPRPEELEIKNDKVIPIFPGIIEFSYKNSGEIHSQHLSLQAVNVFSDQESDISAAKPISIPPAVSVTGKSRTEASLPIATWCAALALVALGLELCWRITRTFKRRRG